MSDQRVFAGTYGSTNCTSCGEPFARHEGPENACPRFSVPLRIQRLWASFGARTRAPYSKCVCAIHRHS